MIKGVRTEAVNAQAVGTSTTVYNMLAIPTGKSFVLSDLVVNGSYLQDDPHGLLSNMVFKLYDYVGSGATAASGVGTARVTVGIPQIQLATAFASNSVNETLTFQRGGSVMHFDTGIEFSTGVTPGLGGAANSLIIGTGCIYIGGVIR